MKDLIKKIHMFEPYSPILEDDPRIKFMSEKYSMPENEAIVKLKDSGFIDCLKEFYKRTYFTENYGWSVPSEDAIDKIVKFAYDKRILEVGAGYGLWAKLLQEKNLEVKATDLIKGRKTYSMDGNSFTDIEDIEAFEAVTTYSEYEVLMLSWPPYDNPMAFKCLEEFKGDKLIYIGENRSGCTANEDFFDLLESKWKEKDVIHIPQWEGIHDYLFLFERIK